MEQRYLADSNTIIDYVGNKMPNSASLILDNYFNEGIAISIISKIEVLGFDGNASELSQLSDFIDLTSIFLVDDAVAIKTIELRKEYRIKVPDAIIAATALIHNFALITRNTTDFKNIKDLNIVDPYDL